jgi:uncharacterized membrane protein YgdD (TMEM256/DUF423 family)
LVVAIGALGAHSLKPYLPPDALVSYETAVRYQFYHTLALLFIALWQQQNNTKLLRTAGWLFVAGIICFSGSVYFLSTKAVTGLVNIFLSRAGYPYWGLLFIAGWVIVAIAALKK